MKLESFVQIVINVSNNFEDSVEKRKSSRHFQVLHSTLVELFGNLTEESYNKIALSTRKTLDQLDRDIFELCSEEYRQTYEKHIAENGRFFKEVKKEKPKMERSKIGFCVGEEGTTI